MKIKKLTIKNFKCLVDFELDNIPDIVMLAGANGTGKSSVIDAIIHLKEVLGAYGSQVYNFASYNPRLINSAAESAEISAVFKIFESEKKYLRDVHNIDLKSDELQGSIKIFKDSRKIQAVSKPVALSHLFRFYDEQEKYPDVGIFEHYNPYRFLNPKTVSGIDLGSSKRTSAKEKRLTASWVISSQKFNDLKDYLTSLAMTDIQEFYKKAKASDSVGREDVQDSLLPIKEIFKKFLSPKELIEVKPFPPPVKFVVKTPLGEVDIDDLSGGEKEVLTVFVELSRLNPRNSIILFDEPELHLHQELQRKIVPGLRDIGENNQVWIATHSMAIIESAGHNELFRLENYSDGNQIKRAFEKEEVYKTFKSVAGDVGIVTLGEKIIFLEGGGDSEVDRTIFEAFTKEDYKRVFKFVSSGGTDILEGVSKKVLSLLEISSNYNFFFLIRDRDFLTDEEVREIESRNDKRIFVLKRHEIENYLLEPEVVLEILKADLSQCPYLTAGKLGDALKRVARDNKNRWVIDWLNFDFIKERVHFDLRVDYNSADLEQAILQKAQGVKNQVSGRLDSKLLKEKIKEKMKRVEMVLGTDNWKVLLPGKEILKIFCGLHNLKYEHFRNQLANKMAESRVPSEIGEMLDKIARE